MFEGCNKRVNYLFNPWYTLEFNLRYDADKAVLKKRVHDVAPSRDNDMLRVGGSSCVFSKSEQI